MTNNHSNFEVIRTNGPLGRSGLRQFHVYRHPPVRSDCATNDRISLWLLRYLRLNGISRKIVFLVRNNGSLCRTSASGRFPARLRRTACFQCNFGLDRREKVECLWIDDVMARCRHGSWRQTLIPWRSPCMGGSELHLSALWWIGHWRWWRPECE
jgi:hypothetical protein